MTSVNDFARYKAERRKISVVTAYEAWSARIAAESNVDAILVGDSAAMVVHGHATTIAATVALMAIHTRAVATAGANKPLIVDLPFLSFRKGLSTAMRAVERLMRAGAHSVKIEGLDGHEDVIGHTIRSGIPVMGHIGLTPQSVHAFGGFRVQGKSAESAKELTRQAKRLEDLGCFSVVLECIPRELAAGITSQLAIPTIGIGAGVGTDGQVLVLHDICGLSPEPSPRFVRRYADGARAFTDALNAFDADVKSARYPGPGQSYS
jgi:3-methyl-2-oxobutanoate hydroxymethyltransferase